MSSAPRRAIAAALVALLAAGAAACARVASAIDSFDIAPNGLQRSDSRLRESLVAGQFAVAVERASSSKFGAPRDELLRTLYSATTSFYSGRYAETGAAVTRAENLADERYTKSISRGAMSLVTNDRVLAYSPGPTERALVNYYGMMAYLRRDDPQGAAVEARRLGALLQRYDDSGAPIERLTKALLHYLTGAVFEAAGERAEADVSYRNAVALTGAATFPPPRAQRAGFGDVVVVIEQGFVAHRVEQSLTLAVTKASFELFGNDQTHGKAETMAERLAERILADENDASMYDDVPPPSRLVFGDVDDRAPTLITLSWPAFRRADAHPAAVGVAADDTIHVAPVCLVADLSDAVMADYRRVRPWVLARAAARAVTKYYLTERAEKKSHVAGWFADVGGSLLERADTRSWHLLPGALSITRLSLPAGHHRISVELAAVGRVPRRVDLAEVDVVAGGVRVVSGRFWSDSLSPIGAPAAVGTR